MLNGYLEIKRHKNKPAQRFCCTLLHREPGYAVLRYVSDEPGRIADICIEAGSTTVAHYWTGRPYVAWRMFDSAGRLIGTLFHVCADVRIFADHLSYEDLLLDIWIAPGGAMRVLDEDELQACASCGLLSEAELQRIAGARQHISAARADIIAGLAAFERGSHGDTPAGGDHIVRDNGPSADI
jgi:hypothetical protein